MIPQQEDRKIILGVGFAVVVVVLAAVVFAWCRDAGAGENPWTKVDLLSDAAKQAVRSIKAGDCKGASQKLEAALHYTLGPCAWEDGEYRCRR